MATAGGVLALISVALIGLDGIRGYLEIARRWTKLTGTPVVTEWGMFNVRGTFIRLGLDIDDTAGTAIVTAVSLALGLLIIVAAGRALRSDRAPDLALGLVSLGMLVTAYHTHRSGLPFLYVLFAACIGRSLVRTNPPALAWLWVVPVVVLHAGSAILARSFPIRDYPVQRYLTPFSLALLVVLAALLLWSPLRRGGAPWARASTPAGPEGA